VSVLIRARRSSISCDSSLLIVIIVRQPISNPHIFRLLLLSQIQTLSLNLASVPSTSPAMFQNARPPVSIHEPIPLSTLTITTSFTSSSLLRHLHASYLPLFNPIHLSLAVHDRPLDTSPEFYLGSNLFFLTDFTRLESLELRGFIPYAFMRPASYGLAALPPPTQNRRRRVRLVTASLLYEEHPTVTSLVASLGGYLYVLGLKTMQKGSVALVVQTEEERTKAEIAVKGLDEAWRGCFTVEVGH
jgi:hypothetical protein